MRLFVALPLPEPLRHGLLAAVEPLRGRRPAARWERAEKLHLTLLFLGEVASDRLDGLVAELGRAVGPVARFEARLGGGGSFPAPARARVLWMGVDGGEAFDELRRRVAQSGGPFVERPDPKPFHPHLTLARCDPPWEAESVRRFVDILEPLRGERVPVDHLALVESELGRGGSRYRDVARFALAGAPA